MHRQFSIVALSVLCLLGYMQVAKGQTNPIDKQVIEWRRHIHQNPELSFKEKNTADYVEQILKKLGNIEVSRPTPTSVLGILKGGKPGKTVAFRADMDALPVQEETGLSFASTVKGVSHACGHDAHTAMLLGTATTLSKMQKQIPGTVYFIFQHAEESYPGGAQEIIKSGALKGVDAFFGVHVVPNLPAGTIGILPAGAASTNSDGFNLTIQGKGSHGSMPNLGVDPIVVGAEVVTNLQTVISRNVAPGEMAVITIGRFQSGKANNVIPETADLGATVRTITDETRKLVADRIKTMVNDICNAYGAKADLNYILSYSAIQNSPELRELVQKAAIQAVGKSNVEDVPRMTASEDFSYYKEVAPICFFVLGVGDGPANHSPKFNLDEKALSNGVKTEVQVIMDYLKSNVRKN